MANLSGIVKQLEVERDKAEKHLHALNAAIKAFANVYRGKARTRRTLSAKARAKIAAAQRARWAKVKAAKKR